MSGVVIVGWIAARSRALHLAAAGSGGNGAPLWPWMLAGLVLLALVLVAVVVVVQRGDEIRFRRVSDADSFAAFAALLHKSGEGGAAPLRRLAESHRRVSVGIAQLASPDAPLRFTLYRGPGSRGEISAVISGEGAERTILVESGETIATARATTGEVRKALEHLVDDIGATGDAVSAAALNRWLG